jgi:hypothetical protein
MIDENHPVLVVIRRRNRTDVDTGGILAVLARNGQEIAASARQIHLENLNPPLPLGHKMPLDAGLGALGRRVNGHAALAFPQVNDHAPGALLPAGCCFPGLL